jgi:peptidoglycan/xylan/chitin deacetylase (PgdA/CDA1 family)
LRRFRFRLGPILPAARDRLVHGPIILAYHRVTRLETDPQLLSVSPDHFREQLAWLKTHVRLLSLANLTTALRSGKVPDAGVVLTFDDGYADNLHEAKPLLVQYEVPATVFIATGSIGNPHEFWWDEIERMLLHPGRLPEHMRVDVAGTVVVADLAAFADYTATHFDRYKGWNELEPTPSPRHDVYRSLHQAMRRANVTERERAMDSLRAWAGLSLPPRSSHRILDGEEVRRLGTGAGMEVGAHTVTHPWLAALPVKQQDDEIRGSKTQLERVLDRQIRSFSYPFGSAAAYGTQAPRIAREVGFSCACANVEGRVWRRTNPWKLPRYLVRDWNTDTFARHIESWMNG